MDPITIDCTSCPVRGTHCGGCMVTALAGLTAAAPVVPRQEHPEGRHHVHEGEDDGMLALDGQDRAVVDRFVATGLLSPVGARQVRVVADPAWRRRVG